MSETLLLARKVQAKLHPEMSGKVLPRKRKAQEVEIVQVSKKTGGYAYTTPTKGASGALARQAKRTGGWANPSGGGELKFVDTTNVTAGAAGSFAFSAATLLNGLASGSTATTRVGRKVTMTSLLLRYNVSLAPTSVGGSPIRILVVYDKQANAAAPAITDILLTDTFNSANNLSNRDRFVTISDFITPCISVAGNYSYAGVIYKRFALETMFNTGSAGTVGDMTSGSVHVFSAQTADITTATYEMSMVGRIRFTDV